MSKLLGEFANLLLGHVYNKIGLSLLLLGIGMVCFFCTIQNVEEKPIGFYIIGVILFLISVGLILSRYKEIRNESEDYDEGVFNMQNEISKVYENRLGKKLPNEIAKKISTKYSSYIGLEAIIDTVRSIEKEKLEEYLKNI